MLNRLFARPITCSHAYYIDDYFLNLCTIYYKIIMNFHNHIIKTYGKYDISIDSKDYDILKIEIDKTIYIKALYTIIGTYNTKKNLWIWASLSKSTDIKNIAASSKLRSTIKNLKIKAFVSQNMGIYSSNDILNNLAEFEKDIGRNIVLHRTSNNIQYFTIDQILLDNRSY